MAEIATTTTPPVHATTAEILASGLSGTTIQRLVQAGILKRVEDIQIPDQLFQPIRTGSPEIDGSFSELQGIIPSQVVLMTGTPGTGKTTLASVIASRATRARNGKPSMFLSYEMSDFQLKLQAKKIPGFKDLLICTEEYHSRGEAGLQDLFQMLEATQPTMLLVDSLQKMAAKMHGIPKPQERLVEMFTAFAKRTFIPVILIGHCDKGGNYAGPAYLKHEVDAHLELHLDKEAGERFFSFSKNRFGGTTEPVIFRITSDGVFIGQEWWSKVLDATPEEDMEIVRNFLRKSATTEKFPWDSFRDAATAMVNYLNKKHQHRFATETAIKSIDKVHLTWEGGRAFCGIHRGQLNFGSKFFAGFDAPAHTRIGYAKEKPVIAKWCKNRGQGAMWVVLHEWSHLFKVCEKHTNAMWNFLDKLAAEENWLFSEDIATQN